jgi:hypothetical protein
LREEHKKLNLPVNVGTLVTDWGFPVWCFTMNKKKKGGSPNTLAKSSRLWNRRTDCPLGNILRATVFAAATSTVKKSERYLQV